MLPEVRAAMDAAAQKYVHLDELTEAVGARLAALTGAEWGLVTNGCSAGLTLATAACVAGGNPDLHVRLPNLSGFPKDEAIIPTHSRNVYDAALRSVGVRVVEVSTLAEFEAALGPRTAMIYILAGPNADNSPLSVKAIAPIAKAKGVPILVDAAAEILTIPNVHLQNGATLVAYSGGKCLRGPQTGGLLLGRKDLVKAAWVHSAPHHGVTRSLKVGKEDAIGMLMAVEMWVKRDHDAEWKRWTGWLDHISQRVSHDPGRDHHRSSQPNGLSNRTPSLRILWDRQKLGIAGEAVARAAARRRAAHHARRGRGGGQPAQTGVSVTPYMMAAGDERIVADRLVRGAVEAAGADRAASAVGASGGPDRSVERAHPVRRGDVDPHAAPDAERERPRRIPPGRVHDPRDHRHDRRRQRPDPQRLRRAAWRLRQPDVHRQGGRRSDERPARHGRVSRCHVDRDAPQRREEELMRGRGKPAVCRCDRRAHAARRLPCSFCVGAPG